MSAIRFKKYLNDNDIKQAWLADQLDVTQQAVSSWVTGDTKPSLDNISKLAEVLNVTITEAVGWFLT